MKLGQDRCLVQRQLNAVNDPMAPLPLEISSDIFLRCLPLDLSMPGARNFPMLLQNVCSHWNAVAISTPALWADMQIVFSCAEGLAHLLPIGSSARVVSLCLYPFTETPPGGATVFPTWYGDLQSD
ncbi:hypothetical protein C8R45DRAFT_81687 [Mycena sanguinolenta]|nr:hypothetical protein C8R45DRAFT_81687 [Mycena sanguinolenta]